MGSHPIPRDYCLDCGPCPTPHRMAFFSTLCVIPLTPLGLAFSRLKRPIVRLAAFLKKDKALTYLLRFLARMRLGKIKTAPHDHLTERGKRLWKEAEARGIRFWEFAPLGNSIELFVAERNGDAMVFQNLPRPFGHYEPSIEWIDDKHLARQQMARASIPIPRGGTVANVKDALKLFSMLGPPVVIKPRMGSFGRHTHLHLRTEEDVRTAFASAHQLCPWVIIEEELIGFNFRATVIGGQFVAALHRDFPRVTGDGVHTIRELIMEENKNPLRQEGQTFFPILMDKKAEQYLTHCGRAWDDVPAKGESVAISGSNGRPRGALIHDATEGVHPENIRLFERIARVTRDPLLGIDFIAETLTKPWHEQRRAGVNELNTMPFLDTHSNPYSGTPRNVTGMLWDLVFPESHAN